MKFSSLFTAASTLIVPRNSQFATEDTDESPQIIYEAVEDNYISETDRLTYCYVNLSQDMTLSNKSGNLFDFSTTGTPAEGDLIYQGGEYAIIQEIIDADTFRVNDGNVLSNGSCYLISSNFGANKAGECFTDGLTFDFGSTDPKPGDIIYFMHDSALWDQFNIKMAQAHKTGIMGVWEFYDGESEDENPDEVTNLGPNLRFDLTTLLGEEDRSGTKVVVSFAQTSAAETAVSKYVGGVNIIETTGLLGQVSPETEVTEYTVGTVWQPITINENSAYDEGELSVDGVLNFELPQTLKQNWAKTTVNGKQAFPIRFRVQELTKSAATFTGTGFNAAGLDSNNYNIRIEIDSFGIVEIDVTGDNGVGGSYTLAGVISTINTALTTVDASLSSAASEDNGQIKITAPDDSLGKDSSITLYAPSGQDATNEIFGLSESNYPYEYIGVGGVPTINQMRIDEGNQYLLFDVVQGETVEEDPLGSSDGSPNQEFVLTHKPLIDGTLVVEVNEGSGFTQYDEVENFLNSDATSKHYTKEITADDEATLKFGDGVNGKVPPAGVDNIKAVYRIGADQDGNAGSRTITINQAGISFVDEIYNPRQATGYAIKEGADETSLQKAKIEGPASLRTLGKAITPADIATLAKDFTSSAGAKPIIRAKAIEETFGIKTIELLVVGTGGALLNESTREEVDTYFNGDLSEDTDGILLTNHEVTTVNYTPKEVDVTVEVQGGNEESIKNAIIGLLSPDALYDDGVTFRWAFGDTIPVSLIIAAIHETGPTNVKNVNLTVPAADIVLENRELPTIGNLSVTVI
jgi:hypothetical protein